jgi:hypothetical protein
MMSLPRCIPAASWWARAKGEARRLRHRGPRRGGPGRRPDRRISAARRRVRVPARGTPEDCARRELHEEAGVIAQTWRPLGSYAITLDFHCPHPPFPDRRAHLWPAAAHARRRELQAHVVADARRDSGSPPRDASCSKQDRWHCCWPSRPSHFERSRSRAPTDSPRVMVHLSGSPLSRTLRRRCPESRRWAPERPCAASLSSVPSQGPVPAKRNRLARTT